MPVFVDVAILQYSTDTGKLEEALSEKTRAMMIAHTLGDPLDLRAVKASCERYDLWLAEDNCSTLGTQYTVEEDGKEATRFVDTISDAGTSSSYPSRHMTMGEGDAVYTDNLLLNKIVRSFHNWGRDRVYPSGRDSMCGHKFDR